MSIRQFPRQTSAGDTRPDADTAQQDLHRGGTVRVTGEDSHFIEKDSSDAARHAQIESKFQVGETLYLEGEESESFDETRASQSRFTLIRKLGQGGLGTVWLARDAQLKRNVAIKELSSTSAMTSLPLQRFQREAEITGHLEHPNIVPLYMSGIDAKSGNPFYVMRFLGKQTLAEAIKEYHCKSAVESDEPLYLHRLLNAFLDACQAIAFAHSRGVIHRDLKPENVALDNFGQVIVLDWGLAKLLSDSELATRMKLVGGFEPTDLSRTYSGEVVGTPLYMAPEQAAGEVDRLDERTDVYGLGAILYSILTGKAPHENSHRSLGDDLNIPNLLKAIVNSEIPRPRDLNPRVSRDLESICMRAMSPERYARHSTATELAHEVESWIAGTHVRQNKYQAMRLSGRDLKSRLTVQLRQLSVTAQFMAELPPIQGLLHNADRSCDDFGLWRERLTSILHSLVRTKSNLSALSYAQITDDRISELVRIERSLSDIANVRSVPQSRLRQGAANTFHKVVMQQFPGESCIDFDFTTAGSIRIVAGVPVFDAQTEEPFGLVLAEADLDNLVRPEVEAIGAKESLFLIDESDRVLFSNNPHDGQQQANATDVIPRWNEITQTLLTMTEYVESEREYYATKLAFSKDTSCVRIVLKFS